MAENNIEFTITGKDAFSGVFSSLKNSISSAGSLLTAVGVTAVVAATKQALEYASAIGETAAKLDFSTTSLQEWRIVADQSGASAEKMDAALGMFSRTMGQAAGGSSEAQAALKKVGVTLDDLRAMSAEQIFEKTRDSISQMGSASQRNATLMQLFGRQGKELGNVFSETSSEISRMRAEAQSLGAVLSEETIKKAKDAKDKLDVFSQVLKVQLTAALVELAPFLLNVTELLAKMAPAAKYGAFVINGLSQGFQELGTAVGGYAAAAAQAAQFNFQGAREILKLMDEDIASIQKKGEAARAAIMGDGSSAPKPSATPAATTQEIDPKYLQELQKQVAASSDIKYQALVLDREMALQKMEEMNLDKAGKEQASFLITQDFNNKLFDLQSASYALLGPMSDLYWQDRQNKLTLELANMEAFHLSEAEMTAYQSQQLLQIEADKITKRNEMKMKEVENRLALDKTLTDKEAKIILDAEKFKLMSDTRKYEAGAALAIQALADFGTMNKTMFEIAKAANIAQAIINTYLGVTQALKAYPPPWSFVAAAAQLAAGMKNVNAIRSTSYSGQAHAGMTDVPREGTFLLDKGERVVAPAQNKDLTNFLDNATGSGGVSVNQLIVNINVPDSRALINMDRNDWRDIVARNVIPALDALDRMGVRQVALERQRGI